MEVSAVPIGPDVSNVFMSRCGLQIKVILKRKPVAAAAFNALVGPAFPADRHIPVIAAYFYLSTFGDYLSSGIYAGIYYGLASA